MQKGTNNTALRRRFTQERQKRVVGYISIVWDVSAYIILLL